MLEKAATLDCQLVGKLLAFFPGYLSSIQKVQGGVHSHSLSNPTGLLDPSLDTDLVPGNVSWQRCIQQQRVSVTV